jgi:hypothetical protein
MQDQCTLLQKVRRICKRACSLSLVLEPSQNNPTQSTCSRPTAYKLLPCGGLLAYEDTLDPKSFPWHAVKFGGFSAEACFACYLQLIPNETSFESEVLKLKRKRRDKPSSTQRSQTDAKGKKQSDAVLYCVCKQPYSEDDDSMIGIVEIDL